MNGYAKKLRDEMYQLKTDANFIELSEKCRSLNLLKFRELPQPKFTIATFLRAFLTPKETLGYKIDSSEL